MKRIAFVALSIIITSCDVGPEPLKFGVDACYACKMTLADTKFGAEIVTKKGKVFKFDDVNCMIGFYSSGYEPQDNIAHVLVVEFDRPENLIDARSAFYVRSEEVRSPMGSNVAAFGGNEDLMSYNEKWHGTLHTWEELKSTFK